MTRPLSPLPLRPANLLWLGALLLGTLLGGAQAQGTAGPAPAVSPTTLTAPTSGSLEGVLAALRTSPGWRGADLSYRAAQLALQSARTRAGLSVSVGGDAGATRLPWDAGEWRTNATLTASASLSVLPWSAAAEGVRAAERALGTAATELRASRASLTVQAVQAYAAARRAATGREAAEAGLALSRRLLEVAQAQRAQGLLPAEVLLDRQAALERAQAARDAAERGVTLAGAGLARLLGSAAALPAQAAGYSPLPDLTPAGDEAALIARALERRPEVARARAALADAQAAVSATQLDARLPGLSAGLRAGQLADAQGQPGRTVSANLDLKRGVLGAQVSVPLRDTGAVPSGVALSLSGSFTLLGNPANAVLAQAQLGAQQAALGLESARQAAELDVRQRLGAVQDARGELTAAQTGVTRAGAALETARARLAAGLATSLDLAQAELTLRQAQDALASARDQAALAGLALALATGDLDPLLSATPPTSTTLPQPQNAGDQP